MERHLIVFNRNIFNMFIYCIREIEKVTKRERGNGTNPPSWRCDDDWREPRAHEKRERRCRVPGRDCRAARDGERRLADAGATRTARAGRARSWRTLGSARAYARRSVERAITGTRDAYGRTLFSLSLSSRLSEASPEGVTASRLPVTRWPRVGESARHRKRDRYIGASEASSSVPVAFREARVFRDTTAHACVARGGPSPSPANADRIEKPSSFSPATLRQEISKCGCRCICQVVTWSELRFERRRWLLAIVHRRRHQEDRFLGSEQRSDVTGASSKVGEWTFLRMFSLIYARNREMYGMSRFADLHAISHYNLSLFFSSRVDENSG